MSEETPETPETPEAPETDKSRPTSARPSPLTKPTDMPIRPGFRNPPNSRSKAQKKRK